MGALTDEKPEPNLGGRPANEPSVPVDLIPDIALGATSGRELREATGVSKESAAAIMRATGLTVEQFQERIHTKMQGILDKSLDLLLPKLDEMSGPQLAIASGIFADKVAAAPKPGAQHLHLHLGGGDRGSLLKAVLGRHSERVSGQDGTVAIDATVIDLPAAGALAKPPQSPPVDSVSTVKKRK